METLGLKTNQIKRTETLTKVRQRPPFKIQTLRRSCPRLHNCRLPIQQNVPSPVILQVLHLGKVIKIPELDLKIISSHPKGQLRSSLAKVTRLIYNYSGGWPPYECC